LKEIYLRDVDALHFINQRDWTLIMKFIDSGPVEGEEDDPLFHLGLGK